ncbi:MAG TPA: VOC family protein [Salinisphaeraceae bacterium]|nr:VOC family protein [Salinisphaeraceae bacterium]
MSIPAFHLAFVVNDLPAAQQFYCETLGCAIGRTSERWIDFDFHGHQITAHLRSGAATDAISNPVDGDQVPVPHFGLILDWDAWQALAERLRQKKTAFVIEPRIRFAGEVGEQATMFLRDPSGNALEFKSFRDPTQIFAS